MAASSTITYDMDPTLAQSLGRVNKITVDWVSAADGTCTATTKKISGRLIKAVVNPGTAAPTANYDIVLTDAESADILANCITANQLLNRHTTTTEILYFQVLNQDGTPLTGAQQPVVCDPITVSITNAGDSKDGRLVLYWAAV